MVKNLIFSLLCFTFITSSAVASLEDGMRAFEQKKYDKALEEFTYLSDENDNIASYHLGLMYEQGLGVEKSIPTAAEYYLKSFNAGNTSAASKLGRFLIEGKDIEKNVEEGLNLLKTAGRAGDKEALYTLGELYNVGDFVDKDYVIAGGYFRLSALQGYAPAQHQLSLLYLFGRGLPQDYTLAIRWMSRAASQGYVPAQKDLADLLASNPRMMNVVEAYAWYSILAAYNTDATGSWAADRRDALSGKIKDTKNLIIAQQLARKWMPTAAGDTVPEDERKQALPIIPGFNDEDTLRELKEQNIAIIVDGSEYGILADDVEQALIKKDTSAIEATVEEWGKNGRPDAYTYWGKIVENRMQDPKGAWVWYRKAADGGDAEGMFAVSKAYCSGVVDDSVNNSVDCYKWLMLAKQRAKEPLLSVVDETLSSVEKQISAEEKAEALKQIEAMNTDKKERKRTFKFF